MLAVEKVGAKGLSWAHQYITSNQVRLHCVTEGKGKLVILLHGLFEFWYSWRYQLPVLARDFKVVVPDLRGYNDSDKPDSGYDLDTLSADIQGLILSLGYERAYIVGHDWGGQIAHRFAQRFPHHLEGLVLLSAASPRRWQLALTNSWSNLQQNWPLLALQAPGLPPWLLQNNLRPLLTYLFHQQSIRKSAFTEANTDIYQAALQKPGVVTALMQHVRHNFGLPDSLLGWLSPNSDRSFPPDAAISSPTLVVWGADDTLMPAAVAGIDGCDALIQRSIPDCGHWIQQEAPHSVNRELMEFLQP